MNKLALSLLVGALLVPVSVCTVNAQENNGKTTSRLVTTKYGTVLAKGSETDEEIEESLKKYYEKKQPALELRNAWREKDLELLHVIHKNGEDCIKVNIDILAGIMMGEDESIVKDLSFLKSVKQSSKAKKSEAILTAVKKNINPAYPADMKQAYSEWLDVIQNKFGFVSKQMIITAQKLVDEEANHDVNKAIDIIHIASSNGWKDMHYAIKLYRERNTELTQVTQNNISVSRELF